MRRVAAPSALSRLRGAVSVLWQALRDTPAHLAASWALLVRAFSVGVQGSGGRFVA